MRWLAAIVLLSAVLVRADVRPSAGSVVAPTVRDAHGWIAMPLSGGDDKAVIVHLPPRRDPSRSDGTGDVEDGSIRPAMRLKAMPERLGAWDGDLWIVFGPEPGGKRQRRVLRMTIERGLGGTWVLPEGEGRLQSLPSLQGDRDLLGFVGTPKGPAALLGGEEMSLLLGGDSAWGELTLPPLFAREWAQMDASTRRVDLAAIPEGLALIATETGRCAVWAGRFQKSKADELSWDREALSMDAGGRAAPGPRSQPFFVAEQLVYAHRAGAAAEVWSIGETGARRLARIEGVEGMLGVVPVDGMGRLALLSDGPPVAGSKQRSTRIAEVSAFSGAVLFDGPANVRGPVSAMELRALAIVLVAVMAVVLIVVLRPEQGTGAVTLPMGLALAEPGRRMTAAVLDLLVAVVVTSWLRRVSPLDLFSPAALLTDPAGLQTMGMVLGMGIVHSTIGEWLFGRTIGKALTGCTTMAIMRAKAGPDGVLEPVLVKPSLWRAAVRNLVRWTLPPLAVAGLNGPDHRHRGDVAAGTVVVMPIEDEAEPGD